MDSENVTGAAISWPAPRRFSLDGLETQGYEKGVVLPIAVTLAHPGAPSRAPANGHAILPGIGGELAHDQ